MILQIDNKGAVDLLNNWSAGGRTRHMVDTRLNYMRNLKEEGLMRYVWCPNAEMHADMFTKNLNEKDLNQQTKTYCGKDEYMTDAQGEGVGGQND